MKQHLELTDAEIEAVSGGTDLPWHEVHIPLPPTPPTGVPGEGSRPW